MTPIVVGPTGITGEDILELAEALIEHDGWKETKGKMKEAPGTGAGDGNFPPWTIHQAIGEASRRVAAEQRVEKDADPARKLRDAANAVLVKAHNKTDIQLNDEADTAEQAIALMRQARGA